tara:strand:+ start:334 stop:615 length:282 start_codon:yes stop_codon:yes gene_type:complete
MKSNEDFNLLNICKILDTDYQDYGGKISRWIDPDSDYNDCSCGCKHFVPLYNEKHRDADLNYGVCVNKKSKRCGLLTFEHQAGYGCFEVEKLR